MRLHGNLWQNLQSDIPCRNPLEPWVGREVQQICQNVSPCRSISISPKKEPGLIDAFLISSTLSRS